MSFHKLKVKDFGGKFCIDTSCQNTGIFLHRERKQRQERYKLRQRQNYINNICGIKKNGEVVDKKSLNSCKAEIRKEFDATIKLVEQIANENKKNAKQEVKNPS